MKAQCGSYKMGTLALAIRQCSRGYAGGPETKKSSTAVSKQTLTSTTTNTIHTTIIMTPLTSSITVQKTTLQITPKTTSQTTHQTGSKTTAKPTSPTAPKTTLNKCTATAKTINGRPSPPPILHFHSFVEMRTQKSLMLSNLPL